MPWSRKPKLDPTPKRVVGMLTLHHKRRNNLNVMEYVKEWEIPLKNQIISLTYSKEMKMIAAGMDGGAILVLNFDVERCDVYKEWFYQHVHTGRVMDLWLDPNKGYLFSIGEDKYLRVYDIEKKSLSSRKSQNFDFSNFSKFSIF